MSNRTESGRVGLRLIGLHRVGSGWVESSLVDAGWDVPNRPG